MKAKLVRTGKPISLSTPQFFFAQDRAIADEAWAGDVVGIPNHGTLRIGDTLTEGEDIVFRGVPSFAPEILRRVRLDDAMKAKKLREALQQMAEEGVVQLFLPDDGSPRHRRRRRRAAARRAGGAAAGRIRPADRASSRRASRCCRWISSATAGELDRFMAAKLVDRARDLDGAPVFLAPSAFQLPTSRSAGRTSCSAT